MTDSDPFAWPEQARYPAPGWHTLTLEDVEKTDWMGSPRWRWSFRFSDFPEAVLTEWSSQSLSQSFDGTPSKARRFFAALAGGKPREEFSGPADFVGLSMQARVEPGKNGYLRIAECRQAAS